MSERILQEPPLLTARLIGCLIRVIRPALSLRVAVATPFAVVLPCATPNLVMAMFTLSLPDCGGELAAAVGTNTRRASSPANSALRMWGLPGVRRSAAD